MGTSCPSVISPIMKYLYANKWDRIANVLDIGIGESGKAAFHIRESFDNTGQERHFSDQSTWKINIVGIEICEHYRNPLHDYLYDKIYWCDMFEALKDLQSRACMPKFDVIFFMATIEHIEKDRGIEVLKLIKRCLTRDGVVVITTPNGYEPQGATDNNPYDEHKCGWELHDFEAMGQWGLDVAHSEVTYNNRLFVVLKRKV